VLRSFFPSPRLFFPAAAVWVVFCMALWFLAGGILEQYVSLGPWLGVAPTEADPRPFFDADRVWLYEYVLLSGYLFCVPWYWIGGNRRWFWWSVVGSVTIVEISYFTVQIEAWLNSWYGDFYNLIQAAIATPNSVTFEEYIGRIWTVAIVLVANITVLVIQLFIQQHYLFRWRRAMAFFYQSNWTVLRNIEGAAQRIQEDTKDFAAYTETIGITFIESVMTLAVFLSILWTLSANITELPWIGHVEGSLVWVALVSAAFGTVLLWLVGIRLPGLEFANQRVEAAYRKELVYGEDDPARAGPVTIRDLFRNVQRNYFRLYFNYLYFNVVRYAYLQGSTFIPYIAMGPAIVTGAITLGLFQQILQAFSQVSTSFRFLVSSWTSIIKLISIYKRLHGFEANLPATPVFGTDYDDPVFLASGRIGAGVGEPVAQE
jgi:peptide/bleomycin uptake transporter